jgi:hypothetical protein
LSNDVQKNESPETRKYRRIVVAADGRVAECDVYDVLEAFGVKCPARQHAIKKLLCAGLRGAKSELADLVESRVSIDRALELIHSRNTKRSLGDA